MNQYIEDLDISKNFVEGIFKSYIHIISPISIIPQSGKYD